MADLSYYKKLLSEPNMKAFLQVIRKGEGTLGLNGYRTEFGGTLFNSYVDKPRNIISKNGKDSSAKGAYQIINSTWDNPIQSTLNLPNFEPNTQDIAGIFLIKRKGAINDVLNGEICSAMAKCSLEWASLPGSPYGQPTQALQSALSFYTNNGGKLSGLDQDVVNKNIQTLDDTYAKGELYIKKNGRFVRKYPNAPKSNSNYYNPSKKAEPLNENTTEEERLQQAEALRLNLEAIENNVEMLEADNVYVSWGSRQTAFEVSDWIGFKQYLMYLSMTYCPQSLVPFVELVPKFLLSEPTSDSSTEGEFEYTLSPVQREKFLKTKQRMEELSSNGGIDLLTLDPFKDINGFDNSDTKTNIINPNGASGRNMGYRIYGITVLNPGIINEETSKAGSIGFKSLEISAGAAVQQGMSLITIELLDVQGNKFLDVTSPWSFLLNAAQINGDFYFRYGWQLRIPKPDKDKNSTGYKFWNHPGWKIFNNKDKESVQSLKDSVISNAQKNEWVLNLTQSPNPESLWYPGYKNAEENGSVVFKIERQLDPAHYEIISMINPEIQINSEDGSITASIQFRPNVSIANCLVPLSKAENVTKLLNEISNGETTLLELMKEFTRDNYNYISNDPKLKDKKDYALNPNDKSLETNPWIIVKKISNPDETVKAADIKIKISNSQIEELNRNYKSSETNITLIGWIKRVVESNNNGLFGPLSADQSILSTSNGAAFIFLYDDKYANNNSDSDSINENALGFLGTTGIRRLSLPDDVFSFRFKGSLIEDLQIENNENPNAQNIEAQQRVANSETNNNEIQSGGIDRNAPTTELKTVEAFEKITWADKKRYLNIMLTKMNSATIKAIAHPWIKLGLTIFTKGMSYFDGKYIVSRIVHKLESDNKFTSEINAIRVSNDEDYKKAIDKLKTDAEFSYSTPNANMAKKIVNETIYNDYDVRNKADNTAVRKPYIPTNVTRDELIELFKSKNGG